MWKLKIIHCLWYIIYPSHRLICLRLTQQMSDVVSMSPFVLLHWQNSYWFQWWQIKPCICFIFMSQQKCLSSLLCSSPSNISGHLHSALTLKFQCLPSLLPQLMLSKSPASIGSDCGLTQISVHPTCVVKTPLLLARRWNKILNKDSFLCCLSFEVVLLGVS